MALIRWFTKNWANTREPTHSDLGPLRLVGPAAEAMRQVEAAIRNLPRWQVESADSASGTMNLTRRTRLWRFVDDIQLRFTPDTDGVRLDAESRSRLGRGDLGQNRRNILELWQSLATIPHLVV